MPAAESRAFDLDSIAALICKAGRYLCQHREDRPGVAFPGFWGLFGGAIESGESADDALQRELLEELGLEFLDSELLITSTHDSWFDKRKTRKAFFIIELSQAQAGKLVLQEGQAMAWLDFGEIMARADRFVPLDLGVIALHHGGAGRAGHGRPALPA